MFRLFKVTSLFCGLLVLSCSESIDCSTFSSEGEEFTCSSTVSGGNGMIVLGNKMNNPYSLKNMQAAYESLVRTLSTSVVDIDSLIANKLYVRFLPQDSASVSTLMDLDLELFDYPLDYEILEDGEWYHDPEIPEGEATWQYTCVDAGFVFPEGLRYEILEECYIPEDEEEVRSGSVAGGPGYGISPGELVERSIEMADLPVC